MVLSAATQGLRTAKEGSIAGREHHAVLDSERDSQCGMDGCLLCTESLERVLSVGHEEGRAIWPSRSSQTLQSPLSGRSIISSKDDHQLI